MVRYRVQHYQRLDKWKLRWQHLGRHPEHRSDTCQARHDLLVKRSIDRQCFMESCFWKTGPVRKRTGLDLHGSSDHHSRWRDGAHYVDLDASFGSILRTSVGLHLFHVRFAILELRGWIPLLHTRAWTANRVAAHV